MRYSLVNFAEVAADISFVKRIVDIALLGLAGAVVINAERNIQAGVADVSWVEGRADNVAFLQGLFYLQVTVYSQNFPLEFLHIVRAVKQMTQALA